MNQDEKRIYLIKRLLDEAKNLDIKIPTNEDDQKQLLRALFNIREPRVIDDDFLKIQDEYLQAEIMKKGVVDIDNLDEIEKDIYLWKGDITLLKVDAIVNAANSSLLGCFYPGHHCIDNAIHTFSGVQLRWECSKIIKMQGHGEDTGQAKITSAFNLPSKFVIHTVGPIIGGKLTQNDCKLLESCYRSCLDVAEANGVKSIAFCCISTGEFHFPNDKAAEIAINTVRDFKKEKGTEMKVVFNVFKEKDEQIYRGLFGYKK
ncbi:protein-ADP-ribose hydrolase [Peptostreptococcus porci]|uniref:protein-ADP-ribose hydrolase n=1 Tax=Peptostreptococcus porci TaxID=2652282 RepID=UPI002A91E3F4|nr:protein-ADP-ribose hydrolase [Peptostreptococcus porci]MDY5436054.1 protein-ADP-ribose hydrolase [Peptostreptococcus porci]MDY5479823.1 protein-ADP-ribose hydrolase [Peptostreptococcus porci]